MIVHTCALDCLLLERVSPPGFWQSVTGSLKWDEQPRQAAVREVLEETGIASGQPIDAGYSERFPILPSWRPRYGPDVYQNIEHVFFWRLPEVMPVTLNPREHSRYRWLAVDNARQRVDSWTNRRALELLKSWDDCDGRG